MAGGVDLDATDVKGDTALHLASARGDKAVVTALVRKGADVNAVNYVAQRPLHVAVRRDHIAVA